MYVFSRVIRTSTRRNTHAAPKLTSKKGTVQKTQSAAVFILLTQASGIYNNRQRSKMCAAVQRGFTSSARRKLTTFSVGSLYKNASVKMCLSFFDNGILIKLSDSEKPDLLMLFFQRKTSKLTMFVLQTYATLRSVKPKKKYDYNFQNC